MMNLGTILLQGEDSAKSADNLSGSSFARPAFIPSKKGMMEDAKCPMKYASTRVIVLMTRNIPVRTYTEKGQENAARERRETPWLYR